jgi:hypothetical protein
MHELLANDLDTLQTRVDLVSESQKASRQELTVSEDVVSSDANFRTSLNSLTEELKRVSTIANDAAQVTVKNAVLQSKVNKLEGQLNLTLQALVDLKQIAPVPKPRVAFETMKMDSLEKDRLSSLEQQVKLLSSKNQVSGTITVFTDLIAGIRTIEDVEAWLLRYYNDIGEEPPDDGNDPDRSDWNFTTSSRKKPDTSFMSFGPFSDLFVVLAIAEDLECQSTKGETLKEMEAFEKAGLNHPGEATVAYALCQLAPPLFSKQIGVSSTKTYLKGLKTPEDWDRMAGGHVFPGLKQKIESHMESIQAEVTSVIEETLERRL